MTSYAFINDFKQRETLMLTSLKEYRDQFDALTKQKVSSLEERQNKFNASYQHSQEALADLVKQDKQFRVMCEQLMQQLHKEQQVESALREDVEKLRNVQRQLPDKVVQFRQEVTVVKDENNKMKNILAEKEKERRQVTFELTKGISFYKDRLGLEFQRVEANHLRLIFTMIDPKKEDRAFYFTIFIDGSKYVMKECDPPLPASQVDALVAEVNINNDFSKFVRAMRRKFKESL